MVEVARFRVPQNTNVLLVENNDADAQDLTDKLLHAHHSRFSITTSHSLRSALKYLIEHSPDIILVDLKLPDSSGIETFLTLCHRANSIPIIILLNQNDEKQAYAAFQNGAEDYLSKEEVKKDENGNLLEQSILHAIERHHAWVSKRHHKRDFYTIAEDMPAMIWEADTDGHFTYVNRSWLDFRGLSTESRFDSLWKKRIHPDDREKYDEMYQQAILEWQCFRCEYRIKAYDGRYHWVLDAGTPRYNDNGDFDGFIGSSLEITEKKQFAIEKDEWKKRYETAIHASKQILVEIDLMNKEIFFDGELKKVLGFNSCELDKDLSTWIGSIHRNDRAVFEKIIGSTIEEGKTFDIEYRVSKKGGELITVRHTAQYVEAQNGQPGKLVGFISDISEKKRSFEAIRDRERKYRTLVSNIPGAVYRYEYNKDSGWSIRFISDEISKISGLPRAYFLKSDIQTFTKAVLEEDRGKRENAINKSMETGEPFSVDYRIKRHDGEVRSIHEQGRIIFGKDKGNISLDGVVFDVTERTQTEEKLNYLVYHDILTGLPNRMLFLDRLDQAVINANQEDHMFAVMFLDLDQFKRINDTLGHVVGDKLIQMASKRLKHILFKTDTVTRIGGDEFMLLITNLTNPSQALKVADKLFEVFKTPFFIDGHELFMTCSIGISVYPIDGMDMETLLKNADTAMNRCKEQGRNSYQLYSPTMNDKSMMRLKMENYLRHAIERKELKLHYQPQIDAETGKTTGIEALLRWNHPSLGLIPPNEFIPLAEEGGLIIPIGEWVMQTACEQLKRWELMGFSALRMSINLSAYQLRDGGFVNKVKEVLKQTGISPDSIEFEVTETAIMGHVDRVIMALEKLKALGVRIAIDDFGTGYSSLSRLKRFPLNVLKIDGSFVRDIPEDQDDTAIAEAIISMAHSMNLEVVAEGVETKEQLDFLRSKGCDRMQGFLYSKPLPAARFQSFLHSK